MKKLLILILSLTAGCFSTELDSHQRALSNMRKYVKTLQPDWDSIPTTAERMEAWRKEQAKKEELRLKREVAKLKEDLRISREEEVMRRIRLDIESVQVPKEQQSEEQPNNGKLKALWDAHNKLFDLFIKEQEKKEKAEAAELPVIPPPQ